MMNFYLFPSLKGDPVIRSLAAFRKSGDARDYYASFHALLEFASREAFTGSAVREYGARLLLDDPASPSFLGRGESFLPYLLQDCGILFRELFQPDWDGLCASKRLLPFPKGVATAQQSRYRLAVEQMTAAQSPEELCGALRDYFATCADSLEGRYSAFKWTGGALTGIARPGALTLEQLGGLTQQKATIVENTDAFLRGLPANDILLVGGSGTGKSSLVKAEIQRFQGEGLKLVEMSKQDIGDLPALMNLLADKRGRYIVFIDDLSFENADADYLGLKVVLDGQLEARPAHILLYATSNRRHLIRETWNDREEEQDIHENDTLHEKMSLSERFGIHLFFPILSQQEYFEIVRLQLEEHGVSFNDTAAREAAAWATAYNGRSGRTAKQFAAQYAAKLGGNP